MSWTEVVTPTPDPEPEPTPTPDPEPEPEEPIDPAPCEHDPPVVKSVKAAEGSNLPESVGPFSFTMKAVNPAFPMVPESENGEKTLTIGADAPYLEGEGNVESYQDGTLLLSVEFGTITFTEEGTYDYTISENPQEGTNYEYDSNVYIVRYEVTNNNGQLEAVRTFYKNNLPVEGLESIVFENTYTEPKPPETISVSGTKTWDDADNQDGKRPASVMIRLHADGVEIASKEVKADSEGKWTYEFAELPKYREGHEGESGEEIVYTITEDAVADYTHNINGFDVTNSYTPGKTSIDVVKVWNDADNQDGIRPNNVRVKLLADGVDTGKTVQLNAADKWEGTFTDLDEKKAGKEITYTVEELKEGVVTGADGPGTYATEVSGDASKGFTITNTHTPETTSVAGTKIWDDADNQDGKRPEAVTIELLADNKKINKVQTTAADGWSYTFDNLPVYANGKRITYTVVEEHVPDYESKVDGFNITNSYTPGKTELTVEKRWDDASDQDGIRPTSVVVDLLADGEEVGQSATLSDANKWQHIFADLPEMQAGKKVYYTVKERTVDRYTATTEISQDGTIVTITNKHVPEMVELSGAKTWDDADNQDGKRPESVTVRLHADGVEVASAQVLAQNVWEYSFGSLPKYNEGKKIVYTLTEDSVEGYTHAISGLDVTNSYTPGKTQVDVSKAWEDDSNRDGVRPKNVTVRLTKADATGAQVPVEGVAPLVLSAADNWTGRFEDLDEYDDGIKIDYGVVEDSVAGYTSQVTGKADRGFTITNYHKPESVQIEVEKTWYDSSMFDAEGKALGDYKRPESVTIALLDEDYQKVDEIELSEASGWKGGWTLPKMADGQAIDYQEYTVAEPEESMAPGFGQEAGHPDLVREGHYRAVVINAPYVREEYTPVEVKLFKYSEAKTIPATDAEEPRNVALPGVKFSVTKAGADGAAGTGGESQTLTTDEDGKATFTADALGQKYVIKETKTLDGYYNNDATFTIGVAKNKLESLIFDAQTGEWVKTYSLSTEALAEGKSPADLVIETLPLSDPDGNYYPENENAYILRNTPLVTLVVEKYFFGAGMRTYEEAPKEFAITLSYTDAAGNAQEKKLTVDPYGEYWNSGGDPNLCRWLVPGIPYNAEVTLKERGLGKQGYALINTEALVWRMDSNAPRYESDMTDEAQVSADNTSVTFSMPAHFDPDPSWKYSEEYGGGSLGLLGARVRFQNYYSTETDITGTKHWIDGGRTHDNASEVTLTLYRRASGNVADAEQVAGATPTWDGNKYTFANQPISDRSGNEYVYWVIEEPVEGYDAPKYTNEEGDNTSLPGAPNGGLITNELSQRMIDVTVDKLWVDAFDQDGKRPNDLTLTLYRTGREGDSLVTEKVNVTPEVTKRGYIWTYTFKDVLAYDSQRYVFTYEVREETVPEGYTRTYCDGNGNPLPDSATGTPASIKNTHTPETTTISGTKTWNDDNNRDGKRPASVTVRLHADGTVVDTKTVRPDESGNWKYEFVDKPKYRDGGHEIVYTVTEDSTENYQAHYRSTANGFDITNKYTPGKMEVSVEKYWDDANNQDGIRPNKVTIKLLANGTDTGKTVELSDANNWEADFTDLYVMEAGSAITYTVEEVTDSVITGADGVGTYACAVSGDATQGFVVTNKHTPETITISGTKTWPDDETEKMGWTVPDSIEVKLQKNGDAWTDVESKTVSKDASTGKWAYTFEGLPKYADGTKIEYRVVEAPVAGFKASGGTATDNYNLTNEYDERTITLTKTWVGDSAAPSGTRPAEFMFPLYLQLYRNGALWTLDAPTPNVVDNGNNTYTVTYVVPRADENGTEYEYKIAEVDIPNYEKGTITGGMEDGFAVTNTYEPRTITLTKTWADDELYSGHRPNMEAFKQYVELLQDGTAMSSATPTVEQGSADYIYVLTYTVPRFKADGTEYAYSIREKAIPYYKNGTVTGNMTDGFAVTNALDAVHFIVHKKWVDEGNSDKRNPADIDWQQALANMFTLNDGERDKPGNNEHFSIVGGPSHDAYDPNTHHEITIQFNDLPKYTDGPSGEPVLINWTITETPPSGYTETHTAITKNDDGDFEVTYTNTYSDTSKVTISGKKTWYFPTMPSNTDILPSEIKVTLEAKNNDSNEWNTASVSDAVKTLEVDGGELMEAINGDFSYTNFTMEGGEWSWTVDKEDSDGRTIEYRVVEEAIEGFSTTGGTKADNYSITNTYISTSGVNFSFVFDSKDRERVPWIAKTKNKTVNDYVSAQLDNGTTVYKYLYTHEVWNDANNNNVKDEGETEEVTDTYYCQYGTDYPYRYYDWYASLEASSLIEYNDENEATLIGLESSVPVKEDVEKIFVYGCFKPDVTKQVSISGTKEGGGTYDGSFDMTLGTDKVYYVNLDPGTYEITVPFVEDSDMDAATINSGVASIHAGDTVTMVTTIKLTVSRNASDELGCTINRGESHFSDAEFMSETTIDTGNIWSESMYSSSTGIGLSAAGNTVTITNYLRCDNPNVS